MKITTSLPLAIALYCSLITAFPSRLLADASSINESPELHVIDVYEGIPHESGVIDVYITPRNKPLVLYFGAYQPVKWNLIIDQAVRIERIVLSGYHSQTVAGVPPGVPILTLPYRAGYSSTGISKPTSLQGGYKGTTFYIGGVRKYEPPSTPALHNTVVPSPDPSWRSKTDLPLASALVMPLPVSYGDGPITSESIDGYKTIAVLKFSVESGASESGSTAAGLVTHLLTIAGFNPVERVQLAGLLKEQELQLRYGDERTMAVNVGHLTGATAVAVGEIHEWGLTRARTDTNSIAELPTVSLSLRIIDAERGTVQFSGHGHFTAPAHTTLDSAARELLKALVTRFELKAGLISTGSLGFSWSRQVRSGIGLFTVTEFNHNSPAFEAGLRSGDIILGCNGSSSRAWTTEWHAKRACQAEANQSVILDVRRGEEPLTLSVRARNRFVGQRQ
jgi:PDZ domain/Curli production assembly/transport component CsgG